MAASAFNACSSDAEVTMLLDEPVAGLDPDATRNMYETISGINRSGVTIIMISHDMDATNEYASHVLSIGKEVKFSVR